MKKAILCVGNELRGDDCVGIALGRIVESEFSQWRVFYGFDTPENEIYAIKEYAPDILVIADAAVGDDESLVAEFMQNEAGVAFNTHSLPLHILTRYLSEFCPKILFLAMFVKPQNFEGIRESISEHGNLVLKAGVAKFKELDAILN